MWEDGVGWVGGAPQNDNGAQGLGYEVLGNGLGAVPAYAAENRSAEATAAIAKSPEGCFSAAAAVGVKWAGALRAA